MSPGSRSMGHSPSQLLTSRVGITMNIISVTPIAFFGLYSITAASLWSSRGAISPAICASIKCLRKDWRQCCRQDLVWVHDYHLIPLGEELRKLGRTQPIGFFLHTPFPAAELFRVLPNHRDLVRSLCAYDLVGFQTQQDLDGFRDYLLRWARGEELGRGVWQAFGRIVRAQVFPIGIDVGTVAAQAANADGTRHMGRLRQSVGNRALMIGVDRLDYSKGLAARFQAYSHLLETHQETRGRTVLIQIAPPSRSEVPEYQEMRKTLAAVAGQINSRYGEFDWTPLRYINKSFSHQILAGFFRASRIALVTPLRDGMNLVAKEYVASQPAPAKQDSIRTPGSSACHALDIERVDDYRLSEARCSTTIAPTGVRPMPCSPGMSPIFERPIGDRHAAVIAAARGPLS
jgi:hypothetical protein